MPIAEGIPAPDFTLPTETGDTLTLSSLRGQWVVLFAYPKDDTSGCTVEACEFRDALPRFDAAKAVILGISPDSVKSHAKFKAKYELPYTLLADEEQTVLQAYDVWKEKSMYGKKYMGVERTTFLIDPQGQIAKVFSKVKPAGHAAEVMAEIG
ncbi:thioredoxin-dependent thiol peroxidase [Gemmatimonas sp.]|jgi:peroxiredoxin Q/BCP|uniref:thioredoxin-dependent thiol peroxidase n=1 Tax=Gemmatimonas sp. TaxID=1962908 RepID=UPI0037C07926